ncbi:MAG: undecaprenyl-diphosphatase [Actinomycetota bacterium]|nr:undecaprenyl-diphosphatase [Actinomycetota bacterium]
MADISLLDSVVLGIVEGLTEFLPVSSTGHLTITEKILGLPIDDKGVTAYTAIIQMGAIAAVLVYFFTDIVRIVSAWVRGLFHAEVRGTFDYRFGWFVIWGSLPIAVVGFLARDLISGSLRSLWVVGVALIAWSAVMVLAESRATQRRTEQETTLTDVLVIGLVQCIALVPGISRSGATISAGLLRGLDRVTATRLSFFLSIPALVGAGLYELKDAVQESVPVGPLVVGMVVSFVVAYASIAWLLRFVAGHPITLFVPYRVALGLLLLGLLAAGTVSPT